MFCEQFSTVFRKSELISDGIINQMIRGLVSKETVWCCGADVSNVSPSSERISSDEGLTLETSALESLYVGQFTFSQLSTLLINKTFVTIQRFHLGKDAISILAISRSYIPRKTSFVQLFK